MTHPLNSVDKDATPSSLVFRQVSKIYEDSLGGKRFALQDVSFDVLPGSIVAIVGRSGSGKSTLLHLAAGIDIPTSGKILINGQDLDTLSEKSRTLLRREQVGLIFQFFHLLPHLSVQDNVVLPALIAGHGKLENYRRVHRLLERVGLHDRINDNIQKLSGGEMQRVAICRALLRKPPLLLADEPTGNLDDTNSRLVMNMMLKIAVEEKSTLIYVTHSNELANLADQVWTLNSGILEP
jgi:putative ABC transport system ATP-binding protein